MKPSDYRRQYEQELRDKAAPDDAWDDLLRPAPASPFAMAPRRQAPDGPLGTIRGEERTRRAFELVRDRQEDTPVRVAVLDGLAPQVARDEARLEEVLELLRDDSEPAELRRTALKVVEQSTFSSPHYQDHRPAYLEILRGLLDAEAPELREDAFERLAIEKDEYAQRRLVRCLEEPEGAPLSPEKAIQLLGYDSHGDHYPLLREVVRNPPNAESKHEAVRLLGADAGSRDLLARLVADRDEAPEIRATGAAALRASAPGEFVATARRIVVDDSEDDDLRASLLTGLAHTARRSESSRPGTPRLSMAAPAEAAEPDFRSAVEELRRSTGSKQLEKAAESYLSGGRTLERE